MSILLSLSQGDSSLLGIAAIISALGGILFTLIGIRKTRRDERDKIYEDCIKRLRESRAEAENLAAALHTLRMNQYDEKSRNSAQEVLERWSHLDPMDLENLVDPDSHD